MKRTFLGFFTAEDISSIDDKESVFLLGIPFERVKTTKRGSRKAPDALRKQSIEFSGISSNFNITEQKANYYDFGNFNPVKQRKEIIQIWEKVKKTNSKLLVLGGDHSITYDTLINAPWGDEVALVWIDAHADLADEYPEGIFQSHGTVFTNLKTELGLKKEQLLFIGGHAYTITSNEYQKIKKNETTNYIATQDILANKDKSLERIREFISKFKIIYLSIDADAVDQAFIPTVATMEPFGLTPNILINILNILLPKSQYVDFVEISYKKSNKTALNFGVGLIFRILEIWSRTT